MLSALWVASANRLVLMIHHLAVDGVSWRILVEDLNLGWASTTAGSLWCCRRPGHRLPAGRPCWSSTRVVPTS
ncbi:condensation domain protein [Mycobacterium xenopi 3993]|nr:condensation domain protein [Mycobacterium xenopi 3993]